MDVSLIVAWTLLLSAACWDLYIVRKLGVASGETASWQLYTDSRKWPVVGLVFGVLTCWMVARTGTPVGVAAWCFVAGHVFASMRGTK